MATRRQSPPATPYRCSQQRGAEVQDRLHRRARKGRHIFGNDMPNGSSATCSPHARLRACMPMYPTYLVVHGTSSIEQHRSAHSALRCGGVGLHDETKPGQTNACSRLWPTSALASTCKYLQRFEVPSSAPRHALHAACMHGFTSQPTVAAGFQWLMQLHFALRAGVRLLLNASPHHEAGQRANGVADEHSAGPTAAGIAVILQYARHTHIYVNAALAIGAPAPSPAPSPH